MLNFLKSLFRKSPAEPLPTRIEPTAPAHPAPPASTVSPKPPAFKKLPMPEGPTTLVSLSAVRAALPAQIGAAQTGSQADPKASIPLPRARVVSQLTAGTVRFTYAELFSWAPTGSLSWCDGQEGTEISVPLSEILSKLSAADYPRRAGQTQIPVPDDIANLFGPKGTQPRPVAAAFRSGANTSPPQRSVTTQSLTPSTPPESAPAVQLEAPSEASSTSALPAQPEAPAEIVATESAPIRPLAALPTPESLRPAVHQTTTILKSQATTPPLESIELTLEDLAKHLAGEIGMHLRAISTTDAKVLMPLSTVEAGLKKGRVLIRIQELASLVTPPIHATQIAGLPDQEVELPMAVMVPLFMATKRPQRDQKKTAIPNHIPDLFKSVGTAPAAVSSAETTTPPQPTPTLPPQKSVTPQSIVEELTTIQGVVGALISLEDGMLVSAKLPSGIDPDFVAAFVPGVFQKGRELLKALNLEENSRLTLPQAAFDIQLLPAGRSLLLLLVRPGTNLPDSSLHNHIASLKKQTSGL